MLKWALVSLCLLVIFAYPADCEICLTQSDCMQSGGSTERNFCCNKGIPGYCCTREERWRMMTDENDDLFEDFLESIPEAEEFSGKSVFKFIGISVAVLAALVVIGLACCCCLPCCLLAKRRQRGQTHGPAVPETQPMNTTVTTAYPGQPVNQGYPPQQHYPPQAYPPQQPPAQPFYPSQQPGYGPPAGYPAQPPPYPGPPQGGVEESYPSKQPAYNPNAM